MAGRWLPEDRVPAPQAENKLAFPAWLPHVVPDTEYVVLLGDPGRFSLLRRKDDLLDDGVAALFGVGGEAELVGLCFQAGRFSPAQAAHWLGERGFLVGSTS
jgi:hypothetical protein